MVENYKLKIGIKTRILNVFRRLFTFPVFEKLLARLCENSESDFIRKLVPPEYLFHDGSFRTITLDGLKYKLDISKVVDHYVYFRFPERGYDSVLDELKKAKFILDIGANIGITSLFFARINSAVRILAFEPHPGNYRRAKEHMEVNNLNRVELLNFGLGDVARKAHMIEVDPHNPGMNRIIAAGTDMPSTEVRVEVLDEVIKTYNYGKVDFIKIDVEGYEYAVLLGGRELITRDRPVIYLELDEDNLQQQGTSAKALLSLLESYGYTRFYNADPYAPVDTNGDFKGCHFDLIARV